MKMQRLQEAVSKSQIRFKGKAQADPPSPFDERLAMAGQVEKAQHTKVCEHLSEACNTAIGFQMGF